MFTALPLHAQKANNWLENCFLDDMSWMKNALIKVDGQPVSYSFVVSLKLKDVMKVEAYGKKDAIKLFGRKEGQDGVVLISLIKEDLHKSNTITTADSAVYYIEDNDTVYLSATKSPEFVGGNEAWNKYLAKNLDPLVAFDNGAPIGIYRALIEFIVGKDGTVAEYNIAIDPGYGTGNEALRVIKSIPAWQPALYNGQPVKYALLQPVVFTISF